MGVVAASFLTRMAMSFALLLSTLLEISIVEMTFYVSACDAVSNV
eukprot:COSAG02_NODE_55_length_43887_cov_30.660364_17_plen_45_part_00